MVPQIPPGMFTFKDMSGAEDRSGDKTKREEPWNETKSLDTGGKFTGGVRLTKYCVN